MWYSCKPIGVNGINNFMKAIANQGGLDTTNKHFPNHSVWKTAVMKLKKAGISSREIMAITGHKNEQNLADYGKIDLDDHLRSGEILSGSSHSSDVAVSTVYHSQAHPSSSSS